MSEINPASESIVEDVRNAIAEKAAVARAELWAKLGYPTAKTHMPEQDYLRDYRGRHFFMNKQVMEQAQFELRIVLCPKCIEEKDYGAITGTRFFITVEDDVMTVFKAMGHFVCHYCGFEEYHPLNHDPREQIEARNHPWQLGQAIWGMTESEKHALYRLYNKAAPPPHANAVGVGSKEEAEALPKLAPIERRRSFIQKLRDLGKI